MLAPFPGMYPYIETQKWEDFHTRFMTAISDELVSVVRPKYVVEVEKRIYLETRDLDKVCATAYFEEHRETFVTIRRGGVHDVVTIIELLSPTNKRPGTDGRQRYVDKLKALMKTKTHYVELNCCAEGSGHRFPSHLREIISRRSAALNGDRLLRFMDGR